LNKLLSFFHLTNIAELCALFAGIWLLRRDRSSWLLFIPQLLLTILVELTGWYLNTYMHIRQNALPFNILMLITISFYMWFFRQETLFAANRLQLACVAIFFLLGGLANLLFGQGLWKYNYFSESAGDLVLATICCLFFYRHLKTETYRDFFTDAWFWLVNGLLLSSMGSAILYMFVDELGEYYKHTHIDLYDNINNILNIIFYSSLTVAFICRHRVTKL